MDGFVEETKAIETWLCTLSPPKRQVKAQFAIDTHTVKMHEP